MDTTTNNSNSLRLHVPRPLSQNVNTVHEGTEDAWGGGHQGQSQLEGRASSTRSNRRKRKLFHREPKQQLLSRIKQMNRLELFRVPLWFFIPIGLAFFIFSLLLVYLLATVGLANVSTSPSLPSISHTGSIYPQYGLFAFTLTWVGAGLVVLFVFKYWQLKIVQRTLKLRSTWDALFTGVNLVILFSGVLCAVFLSLVGIISVGPHPDAHHALTGIFLVFLIIHIVLVMIADLLFMILVQLKIRDRQRLIESIREREFELQMQRQSHLPEVDEVSGQSDISLELHSQEIVQEQEDEVERHVERRDRYLPAGLIVYRLVISVLFSMSWLAMLLSLLGGSAASDTVFSVFEFIVIFFAMCFFGSYTYDFRVGFQTSVLIFERDTSMFTRRPFKRSIFSGRSVNTPASAIATPIPETISVQESQA